MVEYLDGGRIQGSSTLTTSPPKTSWKELDRVTLGSSGDTLDTSTFTAKDNIMFQFHILRPSSGDQNIRIRFNGDSGSNYSERYSLNGGTDATATSQANIALHSGVVNENFGCFTFINTASKEKLCIGDVVGSNADGAGNAPSRREQTFKWANTSDQVTRIEIVNTSSGDFEAGSELVVLGCDNDEADSGSNYWQELASFTRTDNGSTIESGNFATKKYLMVEFCSIPANNGFKGRWEFGHSNGTMDTGSNYAQRWSEDGGSDGTDTSGSTFYGYTNHDDAIQHGVAFIINKSDKEKLVIFEGSSGGSSTGAGNVPERREVVAKWVNTSNQITNIRLNNQISGGDAASGSFIKVWGAD